jgi:hypothetical protein
MLVNNKVLDKAAELLR